MIIFQTKTLIAATAIVGLMTLANGDAYANGMVDNNRAEGVVEGSVYQHQAQSPISGIFGGAYTYHENQLRVGSIEGDGDIFRNTAFGHIEGDVVQHGGVNELNVGTMKARENLAYNTTEGIIKGDVIQHDGDNLANVGSLVARENREAFDNVAYGYVGGDLIQEGNTTANIGSIISDGR